MKKMRGGKLVQAAREDAYVRGLSENGDHICVPWLGVDMSGRYICPGFEFKPNRGLLAYVVPLVLYRDGLQPGFNQPSKVMGPPRTMFDESNKFVSNEPVSSLPSTVLESDYFMLLKRYLRIVKIAGIETETKFIPHPEDYYVIINGPYERSLIGHLMARPDGTGQRFMVADGVDPSVVDKRTEASRIAQPSTTSIQAEVQDPTRGKSTEDMWQQFMAIDTRVGPLDPRATIYAGAAGVRAAAMDLKTEGCLYGECGIPKVGKKYEKSIETETMTVIAPGGPPEFSAKETLRGIQAQDPAKILKDLLHDGH